jgi:hypothetical protein
MVKKLGLGCDDEWRTQRLKIQVDLFYQRTGLRSHSLSCHGSPKTNSLFIQDILEGEQECRRQHTLSDFGSNA